MYNSLRESEAKEGKQEDKNLGGAIAAMSAVSDMGADGMQCVMGCLSSGGDKPQPGKLDKEPSRKQQNEKYGRRRRSKDDEDDGEKKDEGDEELKL